MVFEGNHEIGYKKVQKRTIDVEVLVDLGWRYTTKSGQ